MYICSCLLFASATSVLFLGVYNCKSCIVNQKRHNEMCHVLNIDEHNIDFKDHMDIQTNLNQELISLKQS